MSSKVEVQCKACGEKFLAWPCDVRAGRRKYCPGTMCCPGKLPLPRRFSAQVDRCGPTPSHVVGIGRCWVWTGPVNDSGYGRICVGPSDGLPRRNERAHRVGFFLAHKRWPEPCCLHRCDNRLCVRPSHLFEGTRTENGVDRHAKGRTRPGLVQGEQHGCAKITAPQVLWLRRAVASGLPLDAGAESLGIHKDHARKIIANKAWRHI